MPFVAVCAENDHHRDTAHTAPFNIKVLFSSCTTRSVIRQWTFRCSRPEITELQALKHDTLLHFQPEAASPHVVFLGKVFSGLSPPPSPCAVNFPFCQRRMGNPSGQSILAHWIPGFKRANVLYCSCTKNCVAKGFGSLFLFVSLRPSLFLFHSAFWGSLSACPANQLAN